MKRILGIDPGFGKMGFGCIEVDRGVCRAKDFGVITTKPKEALPNRLKQLAEDLRELVRIGKPTSIAVETLYFKQIFETEKILGWFESVWPRRAGSFFLWPRSREFQSWKSFRIR